MKKLLQSGANLLCAASLAAGATSQPSSSTKPEASDAGWSAYGGDHGGRRFSSATQITLDNVGELEVLWTARTGELGADARSGEKLTFEATPILFDDLLLLPTGYNDVLAIDPKSGQTRWRFNAEVSRTRSYSEVTSRGVATWDGREKGAAPSPCDRRVLLGTIDARLLALDSATGARCSDFGKSGQVQLGKGGALSSGDYQVTSPPVVNGNVVVIGSSIGDNWHVATADGAVRAFDVTSGEELWSFSPIRFSRDGEWRTGAANAWAPMSTDVQQGLVYVPTSSPSPDFYGGLRAGKNQWANSLVALNAQTGERTWAFQVVHHDLWDFDLGAQPTLFEFERDGTTFQGVAQATKIGLLYLFDRKTGQPLHPIEERPAPPSDVPGEEASPTQPFPVAPPPLLPLNRAITADTVFGLNEQDRIDCRALLSGARYEGLFTPPTIGKSVLYPGNAGGTRWGGIAWDPVHGHLIVNSMDTATIVELVPRKELRAVRDSDTSNAHEYAQQAGAPFAMRRREFASSRGIPCIPPPWGTLAAVNPEKGTITWQVPLGEVRPGSPLFSEAKAAGVRGMSNAGGPIVTATGLVFIAATTDKRLRAFSSSSGEEVWSAELPRAGIATPMTFETEGRQIVVVAAGGHGKAGLELGDFVVAFALPEDEQ